MENLKEIIKCFLAGIIPVTLIISVLLGIVWIVAYYPIVVAIIFGIIFISFFSIIIGESIIGESLRNESNYSDY